MRISDWSSDVCSSDLQYLESQGHTLVVTSSKDGPVSVLEKELADAEVVISQPFWPAYLTAERIAKAPKLKLALTAGIGSDHVDLDAAIKAGITVAEEIGRASCRERACQVRVDLGGRRIIEKQKDMTDESTKNEVL